MRTGIRLRLSGMMFLEYFVWGTWYVTLSTWLGVGLHFSGEQIGLAAGTTAVGAMVAPFVVGLIADRYFATERILAVLQGVGAALLWLLARQTSWVPLYATALAYCLLFMPTLALTNSLALRQMREPKTEFGPIRVLGTIGWIAAGLVVGFLRIEQSAFTVRIASVSSAFMALYCLLLPHTPPLAQRNTESVLGVFPKDAVEMLRERSMAVFAVASFLICIPLQFYYAFTNLFLNESGVTNAAAKMTGGQMSELFCMLLIPWFFRRLGVKYMLVAGMGAWTLRYLFFALGNAGSQMWMVWLGIVLHGICYDFFFVTGQIYIDHEAAPPFRAAAQGLITFITYGAGMFAGSWLSGIVVQHYTRGSSAQTTHQWHAIWMIAMGCSAAVLIPFLFVFQTKEERGIVTLKTAEGSMGFPE
jgi:nucleoside transporter